MLDLSKSLAVAISEGRLPLCNTTSEAGALPSEVRIENDSDRKLQGRSLESKMVYRWVGAECGLRKTEKIFSANNEQRTIKRG